MATYEFFATYPEWILLHYTITIDTDFEDEVYWFLTCYIIHVVAEKRQLSTAIPSEQQLLVLAPARVS